MLNQDILEELENVYDNCYTFSDYIAELHGIGDNSLNYSDFIGIAEFILTSEYYSDVEWATDIYQKAISLAENFNANIN